MKTALILLSVMNVLASCPALAANPTYVCHEATVIDGSGYAAEIVVGGLTLEVKAIGSSDFPKRVRAQIYGQGSSSVMKAKVRLPEDMSQGDLGGIYNKNFAIDFPVLPYYKEKSEGKEYLGGTLSVRGQEFLMLCDPELENFFAFEECFTGNCGAE